LWQNFQVYENVKGYLLLLRLSLVHSVQYYSLHQQSFC